MSVSYQNNDGYSRFELWPKYEYSLSGATYPE